MLMTKYFDNIDDLFNHIIDDIQEVMEEDVLDTVSEVQSKNVEKEVYESYDPYLYERRGRAGGLADPSQNIPLFTFGLNSINMFVKNTVKGKDQDIYLAPLVEHGHNNGYGSYQYPFNRNNTAEQFLKPRPFISRSIEELKNTNEHIKSFKEGMNRKGYKFK